jgi:hypothetical protein
MFFIDMYIQGIPDISSHIKVENNFVTVLHALKYNNSSTMQRLTRYLKDIENIFTSVTIAMARILYI